MIPYGRHEISSTDIDAVIAVLRSDYLTQGPLVPRFEEEVARKTGAHFACAVNSATSALHMACMALELGPGDALWTSPITFVASANCALYCGADVDFVDIDPLTWNLCPDQLKKKLESARKVGRLPKIVVVVHFAGRSCDMAAIHELGQQYGFRIIEDAAHAIGGSHQNQAIGSCRFSDITVFSFHPVKIITTAEGGMALTNDPALAEKLALLRSHGITRDPEQMTGEADGPWYYQQIALGYNYRMTDLHAALGLSQLETLEARINRRHELRANYDEALADMSLQLPAPDQHGRSALHLYPVLLAGREVGARRREVFEGLRSAGVGVNVHYIPVHLQPYYRDLGFLPGQFPVAEDYYRRAITLPLFPGLTERQQDVVVSTLAAALSV